MTTQKPAVPEDMNELYDAKIDRVDLVGAAANGTKFLLAKNANGLVPADMVRDLIKDTPDLSEALEVEGNSITPGDRDWEATDSATAKKWIAVLTRAKHAVELLAQREVIESVTADADDIFASWDLEDAVCAIDCAIARLAVYAAGEDGEVMAQDDAAVVKSAAALDPTVLDTVEGIAPLAKAGRVLSAANESALRNAAESIQKVLAGLPAPEDAPVEKEAPVAEENNDTAAEAVEKTTEDAEVAKADALTAVFDRKGNLIGVVAPDAITPVDGGDADADADAGDGDEPVEEAAVDQTEADGANQIDGDATADEDGNERVIPGTDTVQSPVEKTAADEAPEAPAEENVTKTADIAAMLKEALAPLAEKVATVADLAGEFEVLKGRLDAMGREPDDRKSPLLYGANGEAGLAKRGADNEDHLAPLEKAVKDAEAAGNPAAALLAKQQLQFAKIKALYTDN